MHPMRAMTRSGRRVLRGLKEVMAPTTLSSADWRTTRTDPDPDGAGPLLSPGTSWAYNVAGELTSATDPLSRAAYVVKSPSEVKRFLEMILKARQEKP